MEVLRPYASFFLPGDCFDEVLVKFNVFDGRCVGLLLSRFLSFQIILGSILVKVPQIVKCLKAHSVQNLSYAAFLLELVAVTFTSCYNFAKGFPFSSWGESFFIAVQVLILMVILFYYNGHTHYMVVFFPAFSVVVWYLTSEFVSIEMLSTLQALVIPALLLSRFSQILTTFQNKSTGQLSLITSAMNWLGSGARIFTTIKETQDILILANFIAGFAVNTVIILQFFYYPAAAAPAKGLPTEKKKES